MKSHNYIVITTMTMLFMRKRGKKLKWIGKRWPEDWLSYLKEVYLIEVPGAMVIYGKSVFERISSKVYVQYMQLFTTDTLRSIGSIAFPSIVYILFHLADSGRESLKISGEGEIYVGQQQDNSEGIVGIQHTLPGSSFIGHSHDNKWRSTCWARQVLQAMLHSWWWVKETQFMLAWSFLSLWITADPCCKILCGMCSSTIFLCLSSTFFIDNERSLILRYQSDSCRLISCDWYSIW